MTHDPAIGHDGAFPVLITPPLPGVVASAWARVNRDEIERHLLRAVVEAYCRRSGLVPQWKDGNGLRTRRVGAALARHPVTVALRDAYQRARTSFPWRPGDILLIDNMLTAHGRAAFTGPRQVLVAMAEPVTSHARPGRTTTGSGS